MRVKFRLKIPNRLGGKCQKTSGGIFGSHCMSNNNVSDARTNRAKTLWFQSHYVGRGHTNTAVSSWNIAYDPSLELGAEKWAATAPIATFHSDVYCYQAMWYRMTAAETLCDWVPTSQCGLPANSPYHVLHEARPNII